jgi:hypothetical protein
VPAGLELELRVGALALHHERDLLEPADLVLVGVDDLDLPALVGSVARVHVVQVAGEQAGLVAAGSRADLEDDVLVVVPVLREHHDVELVLELLPTGFLVAQLLGGHLSHVRVGLAVVHLAGVIDGREHAEVLADLQRERRHVRMRLREASVLLLVRQHVRLAELGGELLVAVQDGLKLLVHGFGSLPWDMPSGPGGLQRYHRPRRRMERAPGRTSPLK